MWEYAADPVTGYVSHSLNTVDALDGKIPCQRCGGFGFWRPGGSDREDDAQRLLQKHGYVSSKKKWHASFAEFCSQKPEWK